MTTRETWIRIAYQSPKDREHLLPILTAGYVPEPRWYAYTNAPIFYYDIGFPDGHRAITTYIAQGLNNAKLPDNVRDVIVQTLQEMQRTRRHTVQETFDKVEGALQRNKIDFPVYWKQTLVRR